MHEASLLWPVAGLIHFLTRPKLWPAALLANLGAWTLTVALAVLVCWWQWPTNSDSIGWFTFSYTVAIAFGWGLLTFIAGWIIIVPMILGMAFEKLARQILIQGGHEVVEEGAIAAARSSIVFVLRTLHWRLGWLALGVITLFFPPLSWLVGTIALGHMGLFDACDAALAMRGQSGHTRAKLIAGHRSELLAGGLTAGLCGQVLGTTLIGWIFWMPGLYVAAARTCPAWLPAEDADAPPLVEPSPPVDAAPQEPPPLADSADGSAKDSAGE